MAQMPDADLDRIEELQIECEAAERDLLAAAIPKPDCLFRKTQNCRSNYCAALRNAAPALIAELRRLRTELADWQHGRLPADERDRYLEALEAKYAADVARLEAENADLKAELGMLKMGFTPPSDGTGTR